jgi:tetratricopeptide (TPR) repeat protein
MPDPQCTNTSTVKQALDTLRKGLRSGAISREAFCLDSAELYLALNLPKRAAAVLHITEKQTLNAEQAARYALLNSGTANASFPCHKTCSLNMIVRNEEQSIAGALDSVDLIMDELIVCDTGSEDATVSLAEQYGALVVSRAWDNDFSAARNRALDASTCDWIFWMDADDRLEETSAEPLKQLWHTAEPQGAAFCIVNERENITPVEFIQVRLFPRHHAIRFEQKIHEQVMYSIAAQNILFTRHPEIRIRHTGYKNGQLHRKKAERNKPLIIAEIEKNPEDPALLLSLGDCLLTLGETSEAASLFERVTGNIDGWYKNSDVYVQAHISLAKIFLGHRDTYNAKKYFLRALFLDRNRIEAYYALGRMYLDEKDEKKAVSFLMKSARITPPLRLTAIDNLKIRLESIYYLVGLLITWKRYDEAVLILKPAIETYPMVPQYYTQMGKTLLLCNNLEKAAGYFTQSLQLSPVNNEEAYKGMAEIYSIIGDKEKAGEYLRKAA